MVVRTLFTVLNHLIKAVPNDEGGPVMPFQARICEGGKRPTLRSTPNLPMPPA